MNNQDKTFSDLEFNDHANVSDGIQAKLNLGNDIEISVVSMKNREQQFGGLYGNASEGTYEVAVFRNNDMLPLSPFDDVIGWQTEDEITELMGNLQGDLYAQFIANLYITRDESREELGV
tara:strand:+ start:45 stop:404 length:360 start_codon:yes stop_codon:yes gene_type:complete